MRINSSPTPHMYSHKTRARELLLLQSSGQSLDCRNVFAPDVLLSRGLDQSIIMYMIESQSLSKVATLACLN